MKYATKQLNKFVQQLFTFIYFHSLFKKVLSILNNGLQYIAFAHGVFGVNLN